MEFFAKLGNWVVGLLGIGMVALSVGCFWLGTDLLARKAALERGGIDAVAIVATKSARATGNGGLYSPSPEMKPVYTVGYRFADQSGEQQFFEKTVPLRIYGTMEIGNEVPVRYLPADPVVSEIVPGAIGAGAVKLIATGCIGGLISLLGAFVLISKIWRRRT